MAYSFRISHLEENKPIKTQYQSKLIGSDLESNTHLYIQKNSILLQNHNKIIA